MATPARHCNQGIDGNEINEILERSRTHATFVSERSQLVTVAALWHALSVNDARSQWFRGGPNFEADEPPHDFRVGGHGIGDGEWHDGPGSGGEQGTRGLLDGLGGFLSKDR